MDFIGNVVEHEHDGDTPTPLYVCPSCGAAVADTAVHRQFHAALRDLNPGRI